MESTEILHSRFLIQYERFSHFQISIKAKEASQAVFISILPCWPTLTETCQSDQRGSYTTKSAHCDLIWANLTNMFDFIRPDKTLCDQGPTLFVLIFPRTIFRTLRLLFRATSIKLQKFGTNLHAISRTLLAKTTLWYLFIQIQNRKFEKIFADKFLRNWHKTSKFRY